MLPSDGPILSLAPSYCRVVEMLGVSFEEVGAIVRKSRPEREEAGVVEELKRVGSDDVRHGEDCLRHNLLSCGRDFPDVSECVWLLLLLRFRGGGSCDPLLLCCFGVSKSAPPGQACKAQVGGATQQSGYVTQKRKTRKLCKHARQPYRIALSVIRNGIPRHTYKVTGASLFRSFVTTIAAFPPIAMDRFITRLRPENAESTVTEAKEAVRHDLSPTSYYLQGALPNAVMPALTDLLLLKPETFSSVKILGRLIPTPRYTANYMRPYRFSGVKHPTAPLPLLLKPLLDWANETVAAPLTFNQALVNFYMDGGHYIGKHSDDETQLVPGSPIFSASFGQERKFRIRSRATGEIVQDIAMLHGTYIVMCGDMQKEFLHEVPKVGGGKGVALGPRVNVTFRVFRV